MIQLKIKVEKPVKRRFAAAAKTLEAKQSSTMLLSLDKRASMQLRSSNLFSMTDPLKQPLEGRRNQQVSQSLQPPRNSHHHHSMFNHMSQTTLSGAEDIKVSNFDLSPQKQSPIRVQKYVVNKFQTSQTDLKVGNLSKNLSTLPKVKCDPFTAVKAPLNDPKTQRINEIWMHQTKYSQTAQKVGHSMYNTKGMTERAAIKKLELEDVAPKCLPAPVAREFCTVTSFTRVTHVAPWKTSSRYMASPKDRQTLQDQKQQHRSVLMRRTHNATHPHPSHGDLGYNVQHVDLPVVQRQMLVPQVRQRCDYIVNLPTDQVVQLVPMDGTLSPKEIKFKLLPRVHVSAGKTDLTNLFGEPLSFNRAPFLIQTMRDGRYLMFGALDPSLYAKVYATILLHLLGSLCSQSDDHLFRQLVMLQMPYSFTLKQQCPNVTALVDQFKSPIILEATNKIVQLRSVSEFTVIESYSLPPYLHHRQLMRQPSTVESLLSQIPEHNAEERRSPRLIHVKKCQASKIKLALPALAGWQKAIEDRTRYSRNQISPKNRQLALKPANTTEPDVEPPSPDPLKVKVQMTLPSLPSPEEQVMIATTIFQRHSDISPSAVDSVRDSTNEYLEHTRQKLVQHKETELLVGGMADLGISTRTPSRHQHIRMTKMQVAASYSNADLPILDFEDQLAVLAVPGGLLTISKMSPKNSTSKVRTNQNQTLTTLNMQLGTIESQHALSRTLRQIPQPKILTKDAAERRVNLRRHLSHQKKFMTQSQVKLASASPEPPILLARASPEIVISSVELMESEEKLKNENTQLRMPTLKFPEQAREEASQKSMLGDHEHKPLSTQYRSQSNLQQDVADISVQ